MKRPPRTEHACRAIVRALPKRRAPVPAPAPMRIELLQASNGYSIAICDEGAIGDAAWARVEAAGEPWPSLFRALWVHKTHAETVLRAARERFK